MTMRRRLLWCALAAVAAAVLTACAGQASGPQTREVLVDYVHDEVASSFLLYFPQDVTMRPGDSVLFRQEWTGEPHSVTMGTMVDEMMSVITPLIDKYGDEPDEEIPPRVFKQFDKAMAPLPWMFGDSDVLTVNQNAGQPCYLNKGGPPKKPNAPCDDAQQEQPAFNGRQSYYNSGFIPYEGPQGNEFTVELADDIEPGVYNYYCNLHGPFQAGTITVVEEGEPIPSQDEVSRQALREIEEAATPLVAAYAEAPREGKAKIYGQTVEAPLAGWGVDDPGSHTSLNEFVPEIIEVEAGEPVEWTFVGGHTVSFEVPDYFAQIVVSDDGTVVFSKDATQPVNSPQPPKPPKGGGPSSGPPEPVVIDAGAFDGSQFTSSGVLFDGTKYQLKFDKPGSYPYACLIHPQMVGTVEVS
jgi:plastocyanin